ncbi:MAG TPA: GNAT family N-acetyltransferase [Burkholderiales bacterium]|nr:GNAT family N-acetyltransferase [Burkholderiales bacterium]
MSGRYSTPVPDLYFRYAGRDDVPLLLVLIRELAEFEHLLEQVAADEATLADELFGTRRVAEVIIAELRGEAVAFAVFFHNFSTFAGRAGLYLEDLYVRPHARGQGIGRALISFVARVAVERKCGRFEWAVLDWNTRAIDFYRSLGAVAMTDWTVQRVTGAALQQLGSQRFERET